jgi:tetratricopeptide (TPR) repeat protein
VTSLLLYLSWRMIEARIALIWMVVPFLPHLNTRVFPSEELIHDRYLYMTMMGVGLLAASVVIRAWQVPRLRLTRRSIAYASVLVLCALCLKTTAQNRQWLNEEALWAWSAEHAPNSRVVHLALGALAENKRDAEGALREYEAALEINPDIIDALNNAAFVYARSGRWQEAARKFERIVSLTPDKAVAHFNLSFAYAVLKRYPDAAREQTAALDLDPKSSRADEWRVRLEQLKQAQAAASPPQ